MHIYNRIGCVFVIMIMCASGVFAEGCAPSDDTVFYSSGPPRTVQKKVLEPTRFFISTDPLYMERQIEIFEWEHNVLPAWQYATGKGVIIAVVDGGYTAHPDYVECILPGGYDFIQEDEDPLLSNEEILEAAKTDGVGPDHFGAIASLMGARENGYGLCGIAPECQILPMRVFDASLNDTSEDLISDAIDLARIRGARIISLSLGGSDASERLYESTYRAAEAGIIVVAAAGNDGELLAAKLQEPNHYPSGFPWVISVGAAAFEQLPNGELKPVRAEFSNYGPSVDIYAHGSGLPIAAGFTRYRGSVAIGDFHTYGSGTSYATPLVVGAIALALEIMPTLTREQAKALLIQTADDLEGVGKRLMNVGRFLRAVADLAAPDELILSDEPSLTEPPIGVPPPALALAALSGEDRTTAEVLLSATSRSKRIQSRLMGNNTIRHD